MSRRIRRSSIDALLERINLIDVVGLSVQLRRSGARSMGKCPFHEDSSPSFLVDEKHYHCFGCKAHGNVIDFEMNRTGGGFVETVEALADRHSFSLDYENDGRESEKDRQATEERRTLTHILQEVNRAYAKYIWTPDGLEALNYLRERGFSDESIRDWEIGLAPTGSVLVKMAEQRGWATQQLELAGLLKRREADGQLYDFFRDRVIIPIRDDRGSPIAFGGRIFKEQVNQKRSAPKYLNSPETPVFQKSKTLFNLNRARTSIVQSGYAIVVEGYMDCLALSRAGINNVVAVLGTALTPEHLRKLGRLTKRVVLCFDSDAAGREAARRSFEVGFPLNLVELQYASVPSGKDPDEFVKEKGVEAFTLVIERAVSLASWVGDLYMAQAGSREAQVRKIKADYVNVVLQNPDAAVREITLQSIASALGLSSVQTLIAGVGKPQQRRVHVAGYEPTSGSQDFGQENKVQSAGEQAALQIGAAERRDDAIFEVNSPEEVNLLIAFAHSRFSQFPPRLQNVLRGSQSEDVMDEVVLAQLLTQGLSPAVSRCILDWSETLMKMESEQTLADVALGLASVHANLHQLKALSVLDPELLLESGLESWVRGVLEPTLTGGMKPTLRNPNDLCDPANLPFVRMVVRDTGVSRARNSLGSLLSRVLAVLEIEYLDQKISKTNQDIKATESMSGDAGSARENLSVVLRKLASERGRRHQKFLQRVVT
jgi:DNA primase